MARPEVMVVPATVEHVKFMALAARQADRDEFHAASRRDPRSVLELGLRRSSECWAGLYDGDLLCVFGVAPMSLLSRDGVPWLVGSEAMATHARPFLRGCRPFVLAMLERYPRLANHVDARNLCAIRWLRWLGFEIHDTEPYGIDRMPFHPFEKCHV